MHKEENVFIGQKGPWRERYMDRVFCCVVMQMVIKNVIRRLPESLKTHPAWQVYALYVQLQTF
jgi:hypothetical protein